MPSIHISFAVVDILFSYTRHSTKEPDLIYIFSSALFDFFSDMGYVEHMSEAGKQTDFPDKKKREKNMFHITYCDYNRSNPDYDKIFRPNGSGDYLLLYFMTPMKVQFNTESIIAKEGAFLLYSPGHPQIYQAVRKFKNSFIHFTCDNDHFLKEYSLPANKLLYPPNPGAMNELFKNIYMENVAKQELYQEQSDKLMHQLFIQLTRQLRNYPAEADINAGLYKQFQKARIEILTHIEKDWTADNMAALTNLATSQFYHYYKVFFNRSPKSELLDARIERAKYLLRIEALPVGQAALQSGFDNLSHFSRYFKKECGMTPSEYATLSDQKLSDQ